MVLSPGTSLADQKRSSKLLPRPICFIWGRSTKLKTFLGAYILTYFNFRFLMLFFGIVWEENGVRGGLCGGNRELSGKAIEGWPSPPLLSVLFLQSSSFATSQRCKCPWASHFSTELFPPHLELRRMTINSCCGRMETLNQQFYKACNLLKME